MRDEKKVKILVAARTLFDRHGLKKTTVDEIAKTAGIGKGTIYLHFTSKDDIFLAVHRDTFQKLISRYRRAIKQHKSCLSRLLAIAQARVVFVRKLVERTPFNEDILLESHTETIYKVVRDEFKAEELATIKEVLNAASTAGELSIRDTDRSAWTFVTLLNGFILGIVLREVEASRDDLVSFAVSSFFNGISHNQLN